MEMEGEEEGSDTFKALKIGCFTVSVSSSFLSTFGSLSDEKRGNWQGFLYREGEGRRRKRRGLLIVRFILF